MDNKRRLNLRKITMISVLGLLGLVLVGSFVSPAAGAASSPLYIPHIDPHSLAGFTSGLDLQSIADRIPHIDPHSFISRIPHIDPHSATGGGNGNGNGNAWGNIWNNGVGNGVLDAIADRIPHIDPH